MDVEPRPHARPVADDRQLAPPDELNEGLGRTGSIEVAVANHDPFGRTEHRLLHKLNRREALPLRSSWIRIERIGFRLHRAALLDVGPSGVALRDDALDSRRTGRRQQILGVTRA
jgi:hypothetical protein